MAGPGRNPKPVFAASQQQPFLQQRRTMVNAFLRPPLKTTIPSQNAAGEPIDREKFVMEYQGLVDALRTSVVADHIHLLESLQNFDSCRIADLLVPMPDMLLPVPPFGMEHRMIELAETNRYLRAAGFTGSVQELLQQYDNLRACAGDFLYLPNLMLVAETPRTNSIAIDLIRRAHVHKPEHKAFLSAKVEFKGANPAQLADCVGFAGTNVIIVWDDENGNATAKVLVEDGKVRPWYFCRVDPGVDFLSFNAHGPGRYDVICCDSSPVSVQSLAHAGLNPIPIPWSQPKKLGLTMRSVCMGVIFLKQGSGNVHNSNISERSHRRVNIVGEQKKNRGDAGAPFWAQLQNHELPAFVQQPPPRYAPPMHRDGQIVARQTTERP